ncbi:MAG: Ig-like domain-containing protein [Nitrospirae bacterium]|nr:Ig-like domain-containing protein [Nitrospirota bacterium]
MITICHSRNRYRYIVIILIVLLSGCYSRTGKENVLELTYNRTPGPGQTNVPVNTKIQLFFGSQLDPSSIRPDLVSLLDGVGNPVPLKIDYAPYPESGISILTLTPQSFLNTPPVYLNTNVFYTVVLGGGIKAQGGGGVTQYRSWSFSTNNSIDIIPPTFGGALSAEGVDMGSLKLTWGPAVDSPGGTPANQLIYGICYSINLNTCSTRFVPIIVNPSATIDSNGNYNFVLKPLKPDTRYYILVRVLDMAGNEDSNLVQVSATTKKGKLYVANFNNNEILGFDSPSKLGVVSTPVRSIKASQNKLENPYGLFYDQTHTRLYISSCRTVQVPTLIESLDQSNCQNGSSKISVYDNVTSPSQLPGRDQKPDRILFNDGLLGSDSKLDGPIGIFIDASSGQDTLFVANFAGNNITIYNQVTSSCNAYILAMSTNGTCSVSPTAKIVSAELTAPFGIVYDSNNKLLYVSNYIHGFRYWDTFAQAYNPDIIPGTTVVVFDGSTPFTTQNYTALKTISGFNSPSGLWFEPSTDILYVANAGCPASGLSYCSSLGSPGSTIYSGIVAICKVSLLGNGVQSLPSAANCTSSSSGTQYLAGTKTGFVWPIQMVTTIAGSSSTPSLYVSDYSGNKVEVFTPNPLFQTTTVHVDTLPNQEIYGLNYEIRKAAGLAVGDVSGQDNLYLVNQGWDQILLFDQVSQNYGQCIGTAPPYQCVFSSARRISPAMMGPAGIFLNNTPDPYGVPRDRLYVTNFSNDSIMIFDNASGISGNAYSSVQKIIASSALKGPFGIFVDTSQSREWIYVVNSRKDSTNQFAVVVFDLAQCSPPSGSITCSMDEGAPGVRVIRSSDLDSPSGIWVDEGGITINQPRDLILVSNRSQSKADSPGFIAIFKNGSTLTGSVPATTTINGNQTNIFIPTGLYMDPVKDQLYVANQGFNNILVFNHPQNCVPVSQGSNVCNSPPDRTIYNTVDVVHSLDGPSSLVIDFSADQIYVANLGLYNNISSLLTIKQASTVNGQAFISDYLSENNNNVTTFPLRFPESLALDITR